MNLAPDDLLNILLQNRGTPLSGRQILSHFQLGRGERQHALRLLESMADEGLIRRVRKGLFTLGRSTDVVIGKVSVHRQGYGFVVSEEAGRSDVFVPARYLRDVMDGDRVAVRVQRAPRGKEEGRVIRILERAHRRIVGAYHPGRGGAWFSPAILLCPGPFFYRRHLPGMSSPAISWLFPSNDILIVSIRPKGPLLKSLATLPILRWKFWPLRINTIFPMNFPSLRESRLHR